MATQQKVDVVAEFKQRMQESEIAIATRYIGISAGQVTELRKRLRDQSISFKIFKNTLVKRALDELGLEAAETLLEGPTAWAFCKDPVAPAKVLKDFGKDVPVVQMGGGILGGRVLSAKELDALAALPGREALLAQVVGTVAAPLRNLVGVLSAPMRNMANVLEQIRKQKEQSGEAA